MSEGIVCKRRPCAPCCGNCSWFYAETTDGSGLCIVQTEWPYRECGGAACEYFVSRQEMRHHLAVLRQLNRWRRDDHFPSIYKMPDVKEIGVAIDKACDYIKRYSEKV